MSDHIDIIKAKNKTLSDTYLNIIGNFTEYTDFHYNNLLIDKDKFDHHIKNIKIKKQSFLQ
jgi:hypothetical protein